MSVVVPVYRTERFLRECLVSVAAQTFDGWECIVIDDGSDEPGLIDCLAREVLGARATVIHQPNRGLPCARNRGIELARGEFILCLDSDDYLHPQYLAKTVAALTSDTGHGVAFCWTQHVGLRADVSRPAAVELFTLLRRNLIPPTSLFRRQVWVDVGGFDESMRIGHEDWEFWIRARIRGVGFVCVPEPLFYYRVAERSMVVSARRRRVETIHHIRSKHSETYFRSLGDMLGDSRFSGTPRADIVWFWLTSVFFRRAPAGIRRRLFGLYQLVRDRRNS